ncbi:MAG: hypothetical protein AMXMBFR64_50160 [Myxococcales bacterium]
MKRLFKSTGRFAIVGALLLSGSLASAQDPAESGSGAAASGKGKRAEKAPPRVQELEALVIEGRIQKPEVFYVLGRTDARYGDREVKKSFVDKVVQSVRDNPF